MNPDDVRDFAARGQAVVAALWSGPITIAGVDYTANLGEAPIDGSNVAGGEIYGGELLIQISKVILPTCPARETRVIARGRTWVIERTSGDAAWCPVWTLHCSPHN